MTFIWLLIILVALWFAYKRVESVVPKTHTPEPEEKFPVKFYGGPIDGVNTEIEALLPRIYIPHMPEDYEGEVVRVGNMEMREPLYAKYEAIGTEGDYIYRDDLTREEYVREMLKHDG